MIFEIVRNDITKMQVDAIVNTANPEPIVGYGLDNGIHEKAGKELLVERKKIGRISVGEAAITKGYALPSKYVIHTVGPVWQGGQHHEEAMLRKCYSSVLELALENKCQSIAFPLISVGNHGFPKEIALEIALSCFNKFLLKHEMEIYLVVFSKEAVALSEKLVESVSEYIDEHYIEQTTLKEYGVENKRQVADEQTENTRIEMERLEQVRQSNLHNSSKEKVKKNLSIYELVGDAEDTFSEALIKLIDEKGLTDTEVYKKACIDRRLFSKIRNTSNYQPKKITALALAIALELNLDETLSLIGKAGFTLSDSNKFDIIIRYFIEKGNYNIFEINCTLFEFKQNVIGG